MTPIAAGIFVHIGTGLLTLAFLALLGAWITELTGGALLGMRAGNRSVRSAVRARQEAFRPPPSDIERYVDFARLWRLSSAPTV